MDARDERLAAEYIRQLRDGSGDEKIVARFGLASIFEARGMLAEATELLESNVRAGAGNQSVLRRLASLYQRQGRGDLAAEVFDYLSLHESESTDPSQDGRHHERTSSSPVYTTSLRGRFDYFLALNSRRYFRCSLMMLFWMLPLVVLAPLFSLLSFIGRFLRAILATGGAYSGFHHA